MRWCLRLVLASIVLAGCGRSDLLGFDNGCPPWDRECDRLRRPDLSGISGDGGNPGDDGGNPDDDGGNPDDDGGTIDPDGGTIDPDGGTIDPDGGTIDPDGGTIDPDGGTIDPDGGIINPDGGIINPDGQVGDGFRPDGPIDGIAGDGMVGDGFRPDGPPDLVQCAAKEVCGNKIDDDCNGLIDCVDPVCQNLPLCVNQKTEQCTNKVDDDGNGLIDCRDPQCFGDPACVIPGKEICNNLLDDDDDLFVDCADPDCMKDPACMPVMGKEVCDNGVDDNGDKLVDCADPQCVAFPACLQVNCKPEVDFGSLPSKGANVSRSMSTVGAKGTYNTCAGPGGTARVGEFRLAAAADVKMVFTQAMGAAHVVSLHRAGANQACDQNLVFCVKAGQQAQATHTFAALPPGTYRLIVQSYQGTQGANTVTLTTGNPMKPEVCNNGVDDDGDGLTDCADLDCQANPLCFNQQCTADINLGALVVDGPAKDATFDTNLSQNRYHPTCAGTSTGKDIVVRFTIKEAAGILVQWTQMGDHVFGLFATPPPGQPCDAVQTSCYYPGGRGGGSVAWTMRPAGDYLFIFKPIKAGLEGQMHISVSAYKNRKVEICNNNIDDDGNGQTDCDDPACYGVGLCKAPLCVPDVDLGDFDYGTQQNVKLDLRMAPDLYKTRCGKGNGKERVVRLTLTKVMALGFSCSNTSGDAVLQLANQVNPLDSCDANLWTCADPKILPFGCNFAMPNLQPGKYNVIVEAFQAGTEGQVDLTLFGIEEKILEVCNNKIDDDMDGFVDCNDKKCVTSPLCATFQCRADQKLGTIPLDGSTTSAVVPTSNGADDQMMTPCVGAPGGQDGVVDFTLPAKADITIEWAQVGHHAFALYRNDSDLLSCEAGPLVNCTNSMAQATGKIPLLGVAQGKYHLVIDADRPGREGGVVVQISGKPSP